MIESMVTFFVFLDDTKRGVLTKISDINVTKEEIETIILYVQSWTQRQCSCCFRECKNFERFNWALQILILVTVEIVKNYSALPVPPSDENKESKDEDVKAEEESKDSELPAEDPKLWDIEDKDKLIHFVSKVFLNSFPTYIAYRQHMQGKNDELAPLELQMCGQFCEINEPEASPYLFRNVSLFCRVWLF